MLDLLDKVEARTGRMVPPAPPGYRGGNHLWSAAHKLIRLQAARNETAAFQVNLEGAARDVTLALAFPAEAGVAMALYRFDCVDTAAGAMPDALVPLDGAVAIPNPDDPQAAGQANASFVAEVQVARDAPPGHRSGTLTIAVGGQKLELAVDLTVWDFALPDKLSFVPEMNAYGTAAPTGDGRAYYRLAHAHRTCLNRLYYGWNCAVRDGGAPEVGAGGAFDWTAFDRDFGPLFDGSAFADLPRKGEPLDVWYLPFSESWPVPLAPHYRPSYWADEAHDAAYRQAFRDASAAFARHVDAKKWHDTIFEFYLNNKVYYRKDQPKGVLAGWCFDEPANTQDFWALRWYGILFHEGVDTARGDARMWFRADVSRSQCARDLFRGVLDMEVMGGDTVAKARRKQDEQRLWGRSAYMEYGSANDPADPNTQPVVWSLLAWSRGCAGVLPWQVIGGKGCWDKGQATCLFYPSDKGPAPSVRLKAFTRGQQDVEYLALLADTYGQLPAAVAAGMGQMVDLSGRVQKSGENDAGTLRFDRADPRALWELRTRVAAMLDAKHPACKRALHPLTTPATDMAHLPDAGYVSVAPLVPSAAPEVE